MKCNFFLLCLFTCLLCLSCGNGGDAPNNTEETTATVPQISDAAIQGRWNVVQASRNDKPTETLEGAFFDFKSGGRMLTNILGEEQEMDYQLNENVINQSGSQQLKYTIERHTGNAMTLTMTMVGFNFRFDLQKAE
ncbi:MAG: hypothetical protein AAGG75_16230 [Bacteroidota bacterium]